MPDEAVILLAEDDSNQVVIVQRAFREGGITNPLFVVRDGEEAMAYLSGAGKFENRYEFPLPALLLLDLKMPKVDGFEVLQWLRQQPGFSTLVVVVLTSSSDLRDVNRAYQLGANSFLVKPQDFQNYVETCQTLRQYWLHSNKLPENKRFTRVNPFGPFF